MTSAGSSATEAVSHLRTAFGPVPLARFFLLAFFFCLVFPALASVICHADDALGIVDACHASPPAAAVIVQRPAAESRSAFLRVASRRSVPPATATRLWYTSPGSAPVGPITSRA